MKNERFFNLRIYAAAYIRGIMAEWRISMKINEVIRRYRKEGNLTQEQVANYLGVTAPAVNKWENGISYPDITLLAPLARILKIDVDTLLSYHEELTDAEINQLIKEISECVFKESYEAGFEKAEKLIGEYPNCDSLRLHAAELLNAYITIKGVENPEKYEGKIYGWYEVVLTSKNDKIVHQAKTSLISYYMNKGDYEKAQQLLDEILPFEYDKRITQALLYEKQSRNMEAYETYEGMLFRDANQLSTVLQLLCRLLMKDNKYEEAERIADLARDLNNLFELGDYAAYSAHFFLALEKKDKENTIKMLEHMIDGIDTMNEFRNSYLYRHMKFHTDSNPEVSKKLLRDNMRKSAELDFIREEPAAKRLFMKLES